MMLRQDSTTNTVRYTPDRLAAAYAGITVPVLTNHHSRWLCRVNQPSSLFFHLSLNLTQPQPTTYSYNRIDWLISQVQAVSFYLVRWVGVSSVIGQNKLSCDWSE